MNFVMQRGKKDCLSACLATLLGVPIEEIPLFSQSRSRWMNDWQDWMRAQGYSLVQMTIKDWQQITQAIYMGSWPKGVPYLVSGESPRGVSHCCIGVNDELLHDPHPEGGGIKPYDDTGFVVEFVFPRSQEDIA